MAAGVAGTVGNKTYGVDGTPTVVTTCPNAKVATVLFQGIPATAIGAPIQPHVKYGSKHPHGGVVQLGASTVLVGGIALA